MALTFTEKAKRIERVRTLLKRRYGDQPAPEVTHPVRHALRAILAEEAAPAEVDAAMARIEGYFVDLNDLRVSRPREIREVLGSEFPRAGHKARVIPRLLDQVFKHHNSMVWDFLGEMGKVEARKFFEEMEDVRPFVAATVARDTAGTHAFPVDRDISRVLGRLGVLEPEEQAEAEMQAMLERAVKASRAMEVHQLIKRLGEELCVPGTPKCPECPLKEFCPSAQLGAPAQPARKKKGTAKKAAKKKSSRGGAGAKGRAAPTRKAAAKKKPARGASSGGRKKKVVKKKPTKRASAGRKPKSKR